MIATNKGIIAAIQAVAVLGEMGILQQCHETKKEK